MSSDALEFVHDIFVLVVVVVVVVVRGGSCDKLDLHRVLFLLDCLLLLHTLQNSVQEK
jgi:hypothetical protein